MKPTWDKVHEAWVVPHSCPCCQKCWVQARPDGTPITVVDKFGTVHVKCVHGGPYVGYVEVT